MVERSASARAGETPQQTRARLDTEVRHSSNSCTTYANIIF